MNQRIAWGRKPTHLVSETCKNKGDTQDSLPFLKTTKHIIKTEDERKSKSKKEKKKKDLNQSEEAAYSQNISENKLPYICSL